jgi:hypothetical protein
LSLGRCKKGRFLEVRDLKTHVASRWHTIVNLDGSGLNMWKYWKAYTFEGVRKIWPMPSFYAMKLIITFAVFEALLQIYVPGERHISIVSPTGNRAVYKVCLQLLPIVIIDYVLALSYLGQQRYCNNLLMLRTQA